MLILPFSVPPSPAVPLVCRIFLPLIPPHFTLYFFFLIVEKPWILSTEGKDSFGGGGGGGFAFLKEESLLRHHFGCIFRPLMRARVEKEWALWSEECLRRGAVGHGDSVISVFMHFLRNQTVWNCRKVNVEARLSKCVYQSPHSRCAGPEPPLTGVGWGAPAYDLTKYKILRISLEDVLTLYLIPCFSSPQPPAF